MISAPTCGGIVIHVDAWNRPSTYVGVLGNTRKLLPSGRGSSLMAKYILSDIELEEALSEIVTGKKIFHYNGEIMGMKYPTSKSNFFKV